MAIEPHPALAIAATLSAGCFDPVFHDATCGLDLGCPSGLVCAGTPGSPCVMPGAVPDATDAAAPDAAAIDAAAPDAAAIDAAAPDAAAIDAAGPDAVADAEPPADAGVPCNPSTRFDDIRPVPGINTAGDERGASLSPDERTIYLAQRIPASSTGYDLVTATRATVSAAFGPAAAMVALNSADDDGGPSVSSDGTELLFHSTGVGGGDVMVALRDIAAGPFRLSGPYGDIVNSDGPELDPVWMSDGLYFANDGRLMRALKPQGVGGVPGMDDGHHFDPAPAPGDLVLFYAQRGTASDDVWSVRRDHRSQFFGRPLELAELTTDWDEVPEWMSSDGCRLYFSSNRPGGAGGWDLWQASRAP